MKLNEALDVLDEAGYLCEVRGKTNIEDLETIYFKYGSLPQGEVQKIFKTILMRLPYKEEPYENLAFAIKILKEGKKYRIGVPIERLTEKMQEIARRIRTKKENDINGYEPED